MIRERKERAPGLPFPTRPLAVRGGIIEEYVIPDEKKKEVLGASCGDLRRRRFSVASPGGLDNPLFLRYTMVQYESPMVHERRGAWLLSRYTTSTGRLTAKYGRWRGETVRASTVP
jgi:hypothetical protein